MSNNTQPKPFSVKWILILAILLVLLAAAILAALFRWFPPGLSLNDPATPVPSSLASPTPLPKQGEQYRMDIQLSAGQPQPEATRANTLVSGDPLPAADIERILSRLPTLPPDADLIQDFNRPVDSIAPPKPGTIIQQPFPPLQVAPTPSTSAAAALQVLRFAPEGEIPVAPFISVTFDQPMVPLGTIEDLAQADVPARIEPALPGTWRWLGTRTLTFQYDSTLIDRLPKATEYRVTIPAGTRSATGGSLPSDVSWTFSTPAPVVTLSYPYDTPQPLDPIFFIIFDQRIDPASVLATIKVSAGSRPVALRLASQSEIDADEQVARLSADALPGRWLAFRASAPLPPETRLVVDIGPNTPSAEGPRVTTALQSYQFSTYAPLRVEDHGCSWYAPECPPLAPFNIRFNNSLDPLLFNQNQLTISPAIPGLNVNLYGNSIDISGQTTGRTTYTVTLSANLTDEFGQKLGRDTRLTFKVGSASPVLSGPSEAFITLDPAIEKPVFSVYAINYKKLNLRVYAVQPTDWPAFKTYLREWRSIDIVKPVPGKLLEQKSLSLNNPADQLTQVDIPLSSYLSGPSAQFIVIVEPPKPLLESDSDKLDRYSRTVVTWVQVTRIGLDAFSDHSTMLAWATDLRNGAPLPGVTIQPAGQAATLTGADGTTRFDFPTGSQYLLATLGAEQALLPNTTGPWDDSGWVTSLPTDQVRWYVFDDRAMYRPGEQVHLKGWLRRVGGLQDGDVSLLSPALGAESVNYTLSDPQGAQLVTGTAQVGSLGGFDLSFTIPTNANLGSAQLILNLQGALASTDGSSYYHAVQVQEFRRPEFEVTSRTETPGPFFAGGQADLSVTAKYYAGGPLPGATVNWSVTTAPTNYTPPNWPDFTFGAWTPWWYLFDYYGGPGPIDGGRVQNFSGQTDSSGTHYLRLNFDQQGDPSIEPRPQAITAQSSVMDLNRQAWASSTSLIVHPASVYLGLRSPGYFVERGQPLNIDFIAVDLDGKPAPGRPVTITAARMEWKSNAGTWTEQPVDPQTCQMTSTAEPLTCVFQTTIGGSYRITAQVSDDQGRLNQTTLTRWVSGGQQPPSRKVEQEQVTIIPDKQTYQPGDTAHLLIQSPFSPAEGLLTVSRSGTLYTSRFRIESGSTTLDIPILEAHIPNLEIQVDLAGSAPRVGDDGITPLPNLPARPAYATGSISLSIPPLARTLAMLVTPDQAELQPGAETTLTVTVSDSAGRPVPDAELAVVVVDEAILALSNYQLADPLAVFYANRPAYLSAVYSRTSLILSDPLALASQAANQARDGLNLAGAPQATLSAPAALEMPARAAAPNAKSEASAAGPAIAVRSDFNPLAAFVPAARTGLDGTARVPVRLPDNLTRYRIMVVAVDTAGRSFGTGESNLTARLPLMVRPSAPRFLNFGDRFELPVILQNQTGQPMLVDVALRASNLLLSQPGQRVTIPANDRIEVRFPAATLLAGSARVQIAAVSVPDPASTQPVYSDAAVIQLPVYTPATSEAFATYGVIDQGATAQPVQYPTGVFPQFGGLEITTSSTALSALTDAVLYLVSYPYECSEQLASRILAVASLRDVLTAFRADGLPTPEEMQTAVDRDIARLASMQNYDGGFPYWSRGYESSPFNTIHVAHALARATQKGYNVPPEMRQSVLYYLQDIENRYPAWYTPRTRQVLSAYALYVRAQLSDRDPSKAQELLRSAGLDNLPLVAVGWLWPSIDDPTLLKQIRLLVNNRAVETAGAANFITAFDEQDYLLLNSDRRTDAILLDALIQDSPQSDLIPKLVTGLLAHRTQGRWGSTQENVFVLLALDHYFNVYESQQPDFVARLWLGDVYAGSSEFRGRTTDQFQTAIPMSYVLSQTAGGSADLLLSKEGPGRLYYRLGLRYAPTDLSLKPLDMGFVVQRSYEALDDPADVSRDINGAWLIKAGARVRVRISMVADSRRYHVALIDPLPAGLEIINPSLAVSGSVPQDPSSQGYRYGWWWWGTWYEHQNQRDDRAEAFTSLLWDGSYEYSYVARATTPGTFIVPPTRAEEMYSPEVFGRSASDWVIIK